VHFALDRAILAPATRSVLDRAAEAIAPYASVRLQLSGHTDLRASERYNQALSERRVRAVRDYLVAHGVAVERLETTALGESRLLADGQSVGDHARNRRVEIRYLLCDGTEVPVTDQRNDLQLEATRRLQVQREKD
jgi:outer membrane protein OmpA-like peptidoglycan-associated protein